MLRWPKASASSGLAVVWLLVAVVGFAVHANGFFPLRQWLIFFWARAWLGAAAFSVASLATGAKVLVLLRVRTGRVLERYCLATALGVLVFALGIFLAGLCGLLGRAFFFGWPALLVLVGGPGLLRDFRRIARHLRPLGARWLLPQSPAQALAALLILAGCFALYLRALTPSTVGFDARWYHLPIAESYAVAARIRPFPEGWYLGAYPHLGSVLYTWAFLAPGELSEHVCLVVHLELVLVLTTVLGVSALAARLVAGARLRYGGAALFLFPCIFFTDSNLNGNVDDVLAFWAAPLALALFRYVEDADPRHAVLLGVLLGAAGWTKYQALYFLVAVAVVLAVDLVRRRRLRPVLLTAAAALVVSSPHWLKNWIAYGDPLYPNLSRWLPSHPFFHGARGWLERFYLLNGDPPHSTMAKLPKLWRALLEFSFFPHGWAATTGARPLFGSLFTLLLPLALWVRPRRRVLLLIGCIHAGLAAWYFTYTYDRFLQALLPWMAACSAAVLAALWRAGGPSVRVATAVLAGFQLVWGADVHFLHSSMLRALLDHVAAGDEKTARSTYPGVELQAIGQKLRGRRAKLIGHDFYQSLGVGAEVICDNPAWQGSIDYVELDTPERTVRRWRALGATHLLWQPQRDARPPDYLAGDAVFARAAAAFSRSSFTVAGYHVASLDRRAAKTRDRRPTRMAWLACGSERALGIYSPAGLALGKVDAPLTSAGLASDPSRALADVNVVLSRSGCGDATVAQSVLSKQFTEVLRATDLVISVREPG